MSIWGSDFLRPDGEPPPARRQALLSVAPQVLLGLLHNLNREDHRVTIEGLPADDQVVSVGYDIHTDSFVLRLASEEFPEVAEGAVFPFISPTLTEHFLRPAEEATS